MPRLLVTVSSHGYGHFAQTVLVLNALRAHMPSLEIIVRSALPEWIVRSRLHGEFTHVKHSSDFGMTMTSALDVDRERSAAAYRNLHSHWRENVTEEAQSLASLKPDLIFSNIPYLSIAAAAQARIPAIAMCSLNWADIYWHYFRDTPDAQAIYQDMVDAYNQADAFLCPQPSMAMPRFENCVPIGPLAQLGETRRADIDARLGSKNKKLIIVVPGGIDTTIPINKWPADDNIHWLIAWEANSDRSDITCFKEFNMPFADLVASSDIVVTKPGYGMAVESVCNGKPVLYVKRGDWPEEPFIVDWMERYGNVVEISRRAFFYGEIGSYLAGLLLQKPRARVAPSGIEDAAKKILSYF